jgi:hypothetical protein
MVDLPDECWSTPAIIDSIDAAMGDARADLTDIFAWPGYGSDHHF